MPKLTTGDKLLMFLDGIEETQRLRMEYLKACHRLAYSEEGFTVYDILRTGRSNETRRALDQERKRD